jgi:hypothetical protein
LIGIQVYNFIAVARPHYTLPAEAASSPFGHVIEAQPGNEPFSPKQKSQTSNTDSIRFVIVFCLKR